MPFIASLPTFHNAVAVWKYDPLSDTYEEEEEALTGQVYTQLRTQDDNTQGTLYFEYPKEEDRLRDVADYNRQGKADILVLDFPTGAPRNLTYMVRDVQPRWLGFPNEHLMATLDRLSPAEFTTYTEAPPVPLNLSVTFPLGVINGTCDQCGVLSTEWIVDRVLLTEDLVMFDRTQACTCYTSGEVLVRLLYFRNTGLVQLVAYTNGLATTLAAWEVTVPGWDMSDSLLLDEIQNNDALCIWPAQAAVDA